MNAGRNDRRGIRAVAGTALGVLLLGAAPAEAPFSHDSFRDVAGSLRKSAEPWLLLGHYLEAGETAAVEKFRADLRPPKDAEAETRVRALTVFYAGDYAAAGEALAAAGGRDPWLAGQRRYLEGLLRAAEGFSETPSDHFRLRTPARDVFLAEHAARALESAHSRMKDVFRAEPSTAVLVEIYPDEDRFSAASTLAPETLERSGAVGICKFRRLMILSPEAAPLGFRWLDALAHEYNHYLVNTLSGTLCPLWLHEGVARYYETAWRRGGPFEHPPWEETKLADAALATGATAQALIPFARMEPSMVYLKDQDEVTLAFAEVSDAVGYLIEQHGVDKLAELLGAFRRSPRAEAFAEVLGMTEEEFEAAWRESLRDRSWNVSRGAMDPAIHLKPVDEMEFVSPDAQGHIRLGDRLRQQDQPAAALLQYQKALEQEPDNGVALLKAARAHLALSREEMAEELLRHALVKNPAYVTPFVDLGTLLYEQGRYEEAEPVLQEALEINPFHPAVHRALGLIALDIGRFDVARKSLDLALRFNPSDDEVRDALRRMPGEGR